MHSFEPILTLQINRKQIRKTLAQVDIILYLCSMKSEKWKVKSEEFPAGRQQVWPHFTLHTPHSTKHQHKPNNQHKD